MIAPETTVQEFFKYEWEPLVKKYRFKVRRTINVNIEIEAQSLTGPYEKLDESDRLTNITTPVTVEYTFEVKDIITPLQHRFFLERGLSFVEGVKLIHLRATYRKPKNIHEYVLLDYFRNNSLITSETLAIFNTQEVTFAYPKGWFQREDKVDSNLVFQTNFESLVSAPQFEFLLDLHTVDYQSELLSPIDIEMGLVWPASYRYLYFSDDTEGRCWKPLHLGETPFQERDAKKVKLGKYKTCKNTHTSDGHLPICEYKFPNEVDSNLLKCKYYTADAPYRLVSITNMNQLNPTKEEVKDLFEEAWGDSARTTEQEFKVYMSLDRNRAWFVRDGQAVMFFTRKGFEPKVETSDEEFNDNLKQEILTSLQYLRYLKSKMTGQTYGDTYQNIQDQLQVLNDQVDSGLDHFSPEVQEAFTEIYLLYQLEVGDLIEEDYDVDEFKGAPRKLKEHLGHINSSFFGVDLTFEGVVKSSSTVRPILEHTLGKFNRLKEELEIDMVKLDKKIKLLESKGPTDKITEKIAQSKREQEVRRKVVQELEREIIPVLATLLKFDNPSSHMFLKGLDTLLGQFYGQQFKDTITFIESDERHQKILIQIRSWMAVLLKLRNS